MKKTAYRTLYIIISVAVLALSCFFMYQMAAGTDIGFGNVADGGLFAVFLLIVILLHLIKMCRLFIIMLEQKIRPAMFMGIYSETAFVNLMIPFKLGEVFRFYCLSNVSGSWKIGLLSVVVDRFFDTVALLAVLLPFEIAAGAGISSITILLIVFTLIVVMIFAAFPSIYKYMNRFLILNTKSMRSAKTLAVLEEMKGWYQYAQGLMRGRLVIIILLSVIAWFVEYSALSVFAGSMGMAFSPGDFVAYINSIFASGTLALSYFYFVVSGIVLAVLAAVFFIISRIKKEHRINA